MGLRKEASTIPHATFKVLSSVCCSNADGDAPLAKQQKTSAELEDLVHQKLLIGDVYASVRPDPILGWRATVIIAPKHAKAIQERAETVAAELRKKFTLQT
jgi:hypothetical protein